MPNFLAMSRAVLNFLPHVRRCRGTFVGRRFTCDSAFGQSKAKSTPFIVREVRADMLRPHPEISKGARNLWTTMLGMANAKTGELCHRNHWYDGEDIQKRAEICHVLRKRYFQELVEAGFVQMDRVRVLRILGGRLR